MLFPISTSQFSAQAVRKLYIADVLINAALWRWAYSLDSIIFLFVLFTFSDGFISYLITELSIRRTDERRE